MGTLDGNAKFYTKNGTVHELCESDISCAAFTVDGPGEAKRLLEEADMALKNAKGKRRLNTCKDCKNTINLCGTAAKDDIMAMGMGMGMGMAAAAAAELLDLLTKVCP